MDAICLQGGQFLFSTQIGLSKITFDESLSLIEKREDYHKEIHFCQGLLRFRTHGKDLILAKYEEE